MTGNRIKIPAGPARECARCGALGTHYLTCPILRVPRGYRFGQDRAVSTPVTAGEQRITRRPATGDSSSAGAFVHRLPAIRGGAGPIRSARRWEARDLSPDSYT
jgi:hypothetical protein